MLTKKNKTVTKKDEFLPLILEKYKKKNLVKESHKKVYELLKEKLPLSQIVDLTGCNTYLIKKVCNANKLKYPLVKKEDTLYKAIRLLKDNATEHKILAELGISRQRLHQIKIKAETYKLL
jgi:hypothetical protein